MIALDPVLEAKVEGYELAANHVREGRRIGRELNFWGRVAFTAVVFVAFSCVALTAAWVFVR